MTKQQLQQIREALHHGTVHEKVAAIDLVNNFKPIGNLIVTEHTIVFQIDSDAEKLKPGTYPAYV